MRPSSIYSSRASHASSLTSQAANAQLNAKLLEKMKEFDALQALEQTTTSYVRRIEALSKDCEVMADAGKGVCDRITKLHETDLLYSAWGCPRAVARNVPNIEPLRCVLS